MVHHVVAFAVELSGQVLFSDGHTNGVGDTLAQRTGGGFYAHGVAVFGMARGLGAELTELLEIFNGQAVAEEV